MSQIALCTRVKRDDEATTTSTLDVVGQKLTVGLDATKQAFESTFTKENAEVSLFDVYLSHILFT